MSPATAAADRTRPAGPAIPGGSVGRVHQAALERAFGRVFSVFAVFILLDFWFGSVTASGQSPGSAAASALLSLLLIWQAARALRQPPSQPDLYLLAAGTAGLMLAIRILAVPGSPFVSRSPMCSASLGPLRGRCGAAVDETLSVPFKIALYEAVDVRPEVCQPNPNEGCEGTVTGQNSRLDWVISQPRSPTPLASPDEPLADYRWSSAQHSLLVGEQVQGAVTGPFHRLTIEYGPAKPVVKINRDDGPYSFNHLQQTDPKQLVNQVDLLKPED